MEKLILFTKLNTIKKVENNIITHYNVLNYWSVVTSHTMF